jgi:hypothetical protein
MEWNFSRALQWHRGGLLFSMVLSNALTSDLFLNLFDPLALDLFDLSCFYILYCLI